MKISLEMYLWVKKSPWSSGSHRDAESWSGVETGLALAELCSLQMLSLLLLLVSHPLYMYRHFIYLFITVIIIIIIIMINIILFAHLRCSQYTVISRQWSEEFNDE